MGVEADHSDTIVAVSTGAARAALSIVRLSGPKVPEIARRLLDPFPAQVRHATLATAREARSGAVLDQLIALRYEAPRSYTGEAMLELSCHGGAATSGALLHECLALGARVAQPGEFTRRALLHGKLDLAQAEAIADLIDANSEPMRRAALGTVGGVLSRRIAELRAALLQLEAVVAYGVDFPEEDEAEIPRQQIIAMGEDVAGRIGALLETAGRGSILRQGALVVFAGPPNAGKSSLFNALLGQDRAIVTDTPGTTRDAIEQSCMIGDWPVRLVDTAGLRPSNNLIERLGIEISERYVRDAEVCIVCSDGSGPRLDVLMRGVRSLGAQSVIAAETKSDLRAARGSSTEGIWVSAATGAGLADLRRAIARRLDERYGAMDFESPIITRARHSAMLGEAVRELHLFCDSMRANATPTIAAVHLRSAVVALEEIIGAVSVDDLLDEVFSRFCVGK